ncbi:LysR family transcriptional regulator [Yersinia hibernica]|uniref:LysR family transcriptional regulator n=1 Tax=Yersinia hibernica TaxID=2339259 RepID=A0ABX5R4J0_9GAMM|nr:LysR family transcriptional regulator [Yersinia hibernica]QAX80561.1 LysR family transcriptional regulator [Yersinia hibernica]
MFLSRELKSFISVAEEKSIKVAAERLNLSPPAVSFMLKKMEDRLEIKLFKYKNGSMEMSRDAFMLYKDLSSHYHGLCEIESKISSKSKSINIYLDKELFFLVDMIRCYFMALDISVKVNFSNTLSSPVDLSIRRTISDENENWNNTDLLEIKFSLIKKVGKESNLMVLNPRFSDVSVFHELKNEVIKKHGVKEVMFIDDFHYLVEMVSTGLAVSVLPNISNFSKSINQNSIEFELKELDLRQTIYLSSAKVKCPSLKLIISDFIVNLKDRCN